MQNRRKDETEIEWAVRAVCYELEKIGWGDAARPVAMLWSDHEKLETSHRDLSRKAKLGAIEAHTIRSGEYADMIDNTLTRIATALEGIQETLGGVDLLLSTLIRSNGRS